jgi:uncharacterized membrane protein
MRGLRDVVAFCVVLVTLAACSRPADKAAVPATGSSAAVSPPEKPSAPPPPSESGLAIKRGIAMLAQDRATFRPCNETAELWMLDQTDGVLAQAFAEEMQNGPAMLYVEAYGERAPVAEDVAAARAYAGTFVLEEVLYAGVQSQINGCADPAPAYLVTAHGAEPTWSVEVLESGVTWRQAQAPKELSFGPAQTQDAEGAVRYVASAGEHQIELMIDAQTCRDPLTGEFFAYAAKAVFDGREFGGCARVGG